MIASDSNVGRLLAAFMRLRQRVLYQVDREVAKDFGLNLASFLILLQVKRGGVHPKELASFMFMPSYAVSRALDGLVRSGLVHRALDPQDARRTELSLTPEGQRVLQEAARRIEQLLASMLEHLEASERLQLIELMEKLAGAPEEGPS
jgi:DNA-binding MarR family transcriptional regulator